MQISDPVILQKSQMRHSSFSHLRKGSVNNCVQQKRSKIERAVVNNMYDPFTIKVKTPKNMKRTLQTKHIVQEMSQLAFKEITG